MHLRWSNSHGIPGRQNEDILPFPGHWLVPSPGSRQNIDPPSYGNLGYLWQTTVCLKESPKEEIRGLFLFMPCSSKKCLLLSSLTIFKSWFKYLKMKLNFMTHDWWKKNERFTNLAQSVFRSWTAVHKSLCDHRQTGVYNQRLVNIKHKVRVLNDVYPKSQWQAVTQYTKTFQTSFKMLYKMLNSIQTLFIVEFQIHKHHQL